MTALRSLLAGVIDYAGLFPPAALAMGPATRHYAAYRAAPERWMLGRFVVPAARLGELEAAVAPNGPWQLSALVGDDVATGLAAVDAFNARHARARGGFVVDAVEGKAQDADALRALASAVRAEAPYAGDVYVEVPLDPDPALLADAARATGVRLKARTGGVTAGAFPEAPQLARFLVRCAERDVACKATAGLHHALRGEHPLTYEPGCARGTMFGFLNVLVAAALARGGASADALVPLLEERDSAALSFDGGGVTWRGPGGILRADVATIAAARARGVVSFGSCSFEEPVAELRALGMI